MYAERHLTAPITLVVVDDQELVREALAGLCSRVGGFSVVGRAQTTADVLPQVLKLRPEIVLWDVSPQPGFFAAVDAVMQSSPQPKVLLLDDQTVDAHVREALRLQVAGYLTKRQPFSQLESAVREIHAGMHVYAPDVAQRLLPTVDGMRLTVAAEQVPLSRLTAREMDVLVQIAQGYTVKECASILGISASTVDNHKARLMRKLKIHKTVDLTRLAIAHGLLSRDPSSIPRKND